LSARRVVACIPCLLLGLSACAGDGGPAGAPFAVRDSSGIEIVDVTRPAWAAGEGWVVTPEPVLEIGEEEGDEAYQLFRVYHALRLPNGNVVVANRGTQELRWFDSAGRFLRSAGGDGEGAGEFDSLFSLRLLADTLWAHDFRLSRMVAFDTAGRLGRTVILDREPGLPTEVWPVADGFVGLLLDFPEDISAELTYHRRTARYLRWTWDGALRDTIDALPGLEYLVRGGPARGDTFVMAATSPLIGHASQQTVVEDRLVTGSTDRFEIRVHAADGRLERLIRDAARDVPVTVAEWNAVLDEALARAETPAARRAVSESAELRPRPEARPAFDRFVGDRLGYVWIAPFRPARGRPVPWLVLDVTGGGILGAVELPEGLRPMDIGEDWVLGVMRDELEVERVRMFRLRRGMER
jgi:hypothetical protein